MIDAGGSLKESHLPDQILQAARRADFQTLDRAVQLGLCMKDIIAEAKTICIEFCASWNKTSDAAAWWSDNQCPLHRRCEIKDFYDAESDDDEYCFKTYSCPMNLLEIAVLHRQRDVALPLAQAGAEFTDVGAFVIRAWLVGALSASDNYVRACMADQRVRKEAYDIAADVVGAQA